MKISFIFLFVIILLSSDLFAKEGVVIPRGARNVNALRDLEELKESLKVENNVQGVQINVNEVKEVLKGKFDQRLVGMESIILFAEDAHALNVNIV